MKILHIDDNHILANTVKELLRGRYTVDHVATGNEGVQSALSIKYNLILLDLGLPDMDGLEVCQLIRAAHIKTPILIVSLQRDPETTVKLLNAGADDFITKPFNSETLVARIAAVLRRGQDMEDEKILTVSDLIVNATRREVTRSGVPIPLRRKEFDILEYLTANQGRVLTRAMILDHVWEAGTEGWNNTVDVHIKYLRDKIDRPFEKKLIRTAYGVGYVIDDKV